MLRDWSSLASDIDVVLDRAHMTGPVWIDHQFLWHDKHLGPPHDYLVLNELDGMVMDMTLCAMVKKSFEAFRVRRMS